MSVSIVFTKIPIIFDNGVSGFGLPNLDTYNLQSLAHEARTDFAMWLGSLFLLIKGAGCFSIERPLLNQKKQ